MRKPATTIVIVSLACALAGFALIGRARADSVGIEVRAQCVAGSELRLVVEAYRSYRPAQSRSSKTADAKGYYVVVDLSSDKPLQDRARVFGPLWDVPDPRSSISFVAGAKFTREDVDAAAATPKCAFDADGTLLRFTRDAARKTVVRDEFVPAAAGGSWKRQGDVTGVDDDLPPMSESRVQSPSGRYTLLYQNGRAKLFDLFSGNEMQDAWLTAAFADVRSIPDFQNVRLFLTEDRNHLVASPMAIWNNFPGKIFETFEFDGKTYKRADVGLAYSRPAAKPLLFPRQMDDKRGFLDEDPHGAVSIGGELYLFTNDETSLRLYTPDGRKEMVAKADGQAPWPAHPFPQMQHAPSADEVILFDSNRLGAGADPNETIIVSRWNYRADSVARSDVHILDLFEQRDGQLRPKAAVGVK